LPPSPLSPHLLKHLLPRKKKRKLMPSLLSQHLPLPRLRQQRLQKVSLLRKSQLRLTQKLHQPPNNLDDDDFVLDDEVTFGRNRRSAEFGQLVPDDELDDYVQDRLWLARMLALKRYHETHGTT
jgi:hypothetical protein